EKHALTLITPSPAALLSLCVITKNSGIRAALASVMRPVVFRADSMIRVTREKHALALVAPTPSSLQAHLFFLSLEFDSFSFFDLPNTAHLSATNFAASS